jgi:hypothetical protein
VTSAGIGGHIQCQDCHFSGYFLAAACLCVADHMTLHQCTVQVGACLLGGECSLASFTTVTVSGVVWTMSEHSLTQPGTSGLQQQQQCQRFEERVRVKDILQLQASALESDVRCFLTPVRTPSSHTLPLLCHLHRTYVATEVTLDTCTQQLPYRRYMHMK